MDRLFVTIRRLVGEREIVVETGVDMDVQAVVAEDSAVGLDMRDCPCGRKRILDYSCGEVEATTCCMIL